MHLIVEAEDFEDTDATAVAGATATVAADGGFQHFNEFGFGGIGAEDRQIFAELDFVDRCGPRALDTEPTHEALGDHELNGGGHEEGLDAHVHETRDRAGSVVGVQG